jgi:hypothetical protein
LPCVFILAGKVIVNGFIQIITFKTTAKPHQCQIRHAKCRSRLLVDEPEIDIQPGSALDKKEYFTGGETNPT